MTSRQPGVTPPGKGGQRGEGASLESALTAQDWLMRLLPLVLLIVAGLAGLRGAAGTPRWDGPLHQDALVVGVTLEVVIVILFVILLVRRSRGRPARSSRRIRNGCARRSSRGGRRCGPWTTRGPPSSRATWPWRPAWPNAERPGAAPARPANC